MIKEISISNKQKWNEIVYEFDNYEPYYLNEYCLAYQKENHGEPKLIYYNDEYLKVLYVFLLRDIADDTKLKDHIPKGKYYDIVTPYGYGGPLFQYNTNDQSQIQKSIDGFYNQFNQYCHEQNIVSEFIRFNPLHKIPQHVPDYYNVEYNRDTIAIDLTNKENVWDNMKSTSRNRIRKNIDNNMEVIIDNSDSALQTFIKNYYKTMDKNEANDAYYFDNEYFRTIMDLEDHIQLFNVKYDGEYISSALILLGDYNLHYHLGATNPDYYTYSPNNLLFYEAAKWGNENNYQQLHLGGGTGTENDGLYRFKKTLNRFGQKSFHVGSKVLDAEMYSKLVGLVGWNNTDDAFFPLYRKK